MTKDYIHLLKPFADNALEIGTQNAQVASILESLLLADDDQNSRCLCNVQWLVPGSEGRFAGDVLEVVRARKHRPQPCIHVRRVDCEPSELGPIQMVGYSMEAGAQSTIDFNA